MPAIKDASFDPRTIVSGQSSTLTVEYSTDDAHNTISVTVPSGFTVSPSSLPAPAPGGVARQSLTFTKTGDATLCMVHLQLDNSNMKLEITVNDAGTRAFRAFAAVEPQAPPVAQLLEVAIKPLAEQIIKLAESIGRLERRIDECCEPRKKKGKGRR